ncbi:MAG: FAD-dependent oxidoreductase [Acetobacteraceae bacterium]
MRVAVVGAGIVGVSCALHLRLAGHDVILLDPRPPGTATSFGNAGGIVTGAVVPNSTPALRRDLRRILFDKDSAVRLRWSYLPRLAPWLLRFLSEGRDERVREIARALQPLVSRAYEAHRELITVSGADGIVRPVGWLKVYAKEANFAATQYDRTIMAANGVRFDVLEGDEIRQLEPALAPRFEKALFQPDSAFVTSPRKLTEAHAAHFVRIGGALVQERVRGITPEPAGVMLDCEFGYRQVDAVVIAAGAWSQELVRQVGDRVLLDTERGYHLNLDRGNAGELHRPVVFPDRGGFVLAPMQDGIRLTSGVELAGLDAPPDFSRIRRLIPRALDVLPGLSAQVTRQWMGYRPSTPDSLPVIGRSPRSPHVYYAFGHQHLGLTLGPITGRLIAAFVSGRQPEFDVSPYRIERF